MRRGNHEAALALPILAETAQVERKLRNFAEQVRLELLSDPLAELEEAHRQAEAAMANACMPSNNHTAISC